MLRYLQMNQTELAASSSLLLWCQRMSEHPDDEQDGRDGERKEDEIIKMRIRRRKMKVVREPGADRRSRRS